MNISEILARDAEKAWIEKYRKALDAVPTVPSRKLEPGAALLRMFGSVTAKVRRVRDWWQQRRSPNQRPQVQIGNPAVLQTATVSRKAASVSSDARRSRMAS
jgi:hypothetical protein